MTPVLADDFKTVNGKEYKNATVSRVEPDGIVLRVKGGISKVYFTELPNEVQERFHYSRAPATQAMIKANMKAGWKYKDFPNGIKSEHHAWVLAQNGEGLFQLARWDDGQSAVIATQVVGDLIEANDCSDDTCVLSYAIIHVKLDDDQIYAYRITVQSDFGSDHGLIHGQVLDSLIAMLRTAKTMRIEVPIYKRGTVVYTFDVAGLQW